MRPIRRWSGGSPRVFRDTDGDLGALARALVADDAAWSAPATKMRNPWELTVAAYRAFARSPSDPGPALNALNLLGMPLWQPGGPNGFSDDSVAAWASPEGMKTRRRARGAVRRARSRTRRARPTLLDDVLGPTASTRDARGGGARRDARAGLCAADPVARIPAEMSDDRIRRLPHPSRRASWRRRRDLRLRDDPALGERGGRARSAPGRRHPARRARRALGRRADRRSRLRRSAWRAGAAAGTARIRRCRSTTSSASIRRWRISPGSTTRKQALVVHATATNYRERSHFDGQDVLESGMPGAGPGRERLAQSRRRRAAGGRAGRRRRAGAGGRRDGAAGHARPGADPRLGAFGPRRADRRPHRAADGPLRPRRSGARQGAAGRARRRPASPIGRAWMRSSPAATSRC